MKTLWEAEKQRIVQDMKVAHAKELEKSITETKKKHWVRNTADRSHSVGLLVFNIFTVLLDFQHVVHAYPLRVSENHTFLSVIRTESLVCYTGPKQILSVQINSNRIFTFTNCCSM